MQTLSTVLSEGRPARTSAFCTGIHHMDVGRGVHRSLVNKNTLLYYRTEQDANNHPRGQIELSAAITVEVCARPLSASAQLATGPPARSHRFVERSWLGSYSAPSVQWTLLTPVDAINQCRSNPVFHRRVSYLLNCALYMHNLSSAKCDRYCAICHMGLY